MPGAEVRPGAPRRRDQAFERALRCSLLLLAASPSFAQSDDGAGVVPQSLDNSHDASVGGPNATCSAATSDQAGNVALGSLAPYSRTQAWTTYSPDGQRLGQFESSQLTAFPQPVGFETSWRDESHAFGSVWSATSSTSRPAPPARTLAR